MRPILQYNCQIWSSAYLYLVKKHERVQKRVTKRCFSVLPSREKLNHLATDSLALIRMLKLGLVIDVQDYLQQHRCRQSPWIPIVFMLLDITTNKAFYFFLLFFVCNYCLKFPVDSIYDLSDVVNNCLFHAFAAACLEAVPSLSSDQGIDTRQCRIHCQMICWLSWLWIYVTNLENTSMPRTLPSVIALYKIDILLTYLLLCHLWWAAFAAFMQ